jgi:hypothetical protein
VMNHVVQLGEYRGEEINLDSTFTCPAAHLGTGKCQLPSFPCVPACPLLPCCLAAWIPITQNEPIVDPKQRTAAAATACAKGSRQPVERPICSTWRHTKFPDRSRLARTAASHRPVLSSGEANGWFLAKDLRS